MAFEVVMPRLSDSMEEGTILRWLKKAGEQVKRGEEIVEIESDKASMPYAADGGGYLEIVAEEGQTLPVGAPIARLHEQPLTASAPGTEPPQREVAKGPAEQEQHSPAPATAELPPKETPLSGEQGRIKAYPLARRIARERGVDLRSLVGSGPEGRIVRADVERAVDTAQPTPPTTGADGGTSPQAPTPVVGPRGRSRRYELSRPQQVVARRMAESMATIPHFTLHCEVDMERCVELRATVKAQAKGEVVPTYNDMLIKACALALREHPRLNASYRDGALELHERVNVGFAVAAGLEDELSARLVVPTIVDADKASLGTIARQTRELAERVREGTITPPELAGATFTISNLGMFGVSWFTAIIDPPNVAILAAGEVAPKAVVHQGEVKARQRMGLTLSLDHRAVYGAEGALFLGRIRQLLEEPTGLLL